MKKVLKWRQVPIFLNPTFIKWPGGVKAFVYALVVVVNKTLKLSEIICWDICQASPAMKYNNTHIEYSKSKGGRSVKSCL